MTANQTSRGAGSRLSFGRFALVGSCISLLAACSGSIEQTDVDRARADRASGLTPAAPASTNSTAQAPARSVVATPAPASNSTPAATPPAATPPAATPPAATPPAATPPAAAGDVSFEADVYPIFVESCAPCHTVANLGAQNVGNPDKALALADAKRVKAALVSRLGNGSMPPSGCNKPPGSGGACISQEDFDLVKDWAEGDTLP